MSVYHSSWVCCRATRARLQLNFAAYALTLRRHYSVLNNAEMIVGLAISLRYLLRCGFQTEFYFVRCFSKRQVNSVRTAPFC